MGIFCQMKTNSSIHHATRRLGFAVRGVVGALLFCHAKAQGAVAGTRDTMFREIPKDGDSSVWSVVLQPDGHILVGVTRVNGQAVTSIVRLFPDGMPEPLATFNPGTGPNNEVSSIAVQPDGRIILAGSFTAVNGEVRNRIARLLPDGTLESTTTFNPGTGVDGRVGPIALQPDGKILIAGSFTAVNGLPRPGVARLLTDGTVEPLSSFDVGSGPSGEIFTMTLQEDGKIFLGGPSSVFNGQPPIRILPNGALDTAFQTNFSANDFVHTSIMTPENTLRVGGKFLVPVPPSGQLLSGVVRTNYDGGGAVRWLPLGSDPDNGYVNTLAACRA